MKPVSPTVATLEKISQRQLDDIIKNHGVFLKGIRGGARAVVKFKDLTGLNFKGADLSQADFTGSVLADANLALGTFRGTSFFACDLRGANLEHGNFARADFRGAFVAGANLTGADLKEADLRSGKVMEKGKNGILQNVPRRDIPDDPHYRTVFSGAKMTETDMSKARAMSADFSDADLTGVVVQNANLEGANFEGANLSNADFTGANLSDTNLFASILTNTIIDHAETGGSNIKEVISREKTGSKIEDLGKPLSELLTDHTAWVVSAGRSGKRLDLSGFDLRPVSDLKQYALTAVKAVNANFMNLKLSDVGMQSALLDRSDFRDCKLDKADLRGASLKNALLSRTDLSHANLGPLQFTNPDGSTWLQRVNLSGANLRYAIIHGADLRDAIMMGVDLSYAVLIDCDLRRADLTGATLDNADLTDAMMQGAIMDEKYRE
ncbi:MAG: pentapeptide repeat-containing protein [Proteobacteria bacterium]|nr:pentapeptide repeat-containing protein [Pseudomonadota bacterium]